MEILHLKGGWRSIKSTLEGIDATLEGKDDHLIYAYMDAMPALANRHGDFGFKGRLAKLSQIQLRPSCTVVDG